jgi:hypothetical protein
MYMCKTYKFFVSIRLRPCCTSSSRPLPVVVVARCGWSGRPAGGGGGGGDAAAGRVRVVCSRCRPAGGGRGVGFVIILKTLLVTGKKHE